MDSTNNTNYSIKYPVLSFILLLLCSCSREENGNTFDLFFFNARECNAVTLFQPDSETDSLSVIMCIADGKMNTYMGFNGEIMHYDRQEIRIIQQFIQDNPWIKHINVPDEQVYGLYPARAEYRMEKVSSIRLFSTEEVLGRKPNMVLNDLFSIKNGGIEGMKPLVLWWYSDFILFDDGGSISHLSEIKTIEELLSKKPMMPASILFESSISKKMIPDIFNLGVEVILENGKTLRDTLRIVK